MTKDKAATAQRMYGQQELTVEQIARARGVSRSAIYRALNRTGSIARWEAGHKELPVLVTPPRGTRPRKPWMTTFSDCCSRLIMGWALALRPDAAPVLAALRRGLVADPHRGSFGGVPQVLVPGNGLEFAATALARVCATLGVGLDPAGAYSPQQKGKVDKAGRTVDQELLSGLPFYAGGPRAVDGQLYGPDAPPMSLALFTSRFAAWVSEYNTARPHPALGGPTPLQRWDADPTPIREVPGEQLRWLLLADAERAIGRDGIRFGGCTFIAGELNGRVGGRAQIRCTPHDLRQIEVFRGDLWLCTAWPQGALTGEQRRAVLERRRADAAELGRRQRQASRRARARLAPVTEPGTPGEVTVISAGQARTGRWHRDRDGERDIGARDRDRQRLARTGLLNLHTDFDCWNPPRDGDTPPAGTGAGSRDDAGDERTGDKG
jgi:putative transposase